MGRGADARAFAAAGPAGLGPRADARASGGRGAGRARAPCGCARIWGEGAQMRAHPGKAAGIKVETVLLPAKTRATRTPCLSSDANARAFAAAECGCARICGRPTGPDTNARALAGGTRGRARMRAHSRVRGGYWAAEATGARGRREAAAGSQGPGARAHGKKDGPGRPASGVSRPAGCAPHGRREVSGQDGEGEGPLAREGRCVSRGAGRRRPGAPRSQGPGRRPRACGHEAYSAATSSGSAASDSAAAASSAFLERWQYTPAATAAPASSTSTPPRR